jgi:hypothetical protein
MRQATLAGLATLAIVATGCSGTPAAGRGSSPGPTGASTAPAVSPVGLINVFNLRRALANGVGPADYVGSIPAQIAPVGLAFSPDGRWLYSPARQRACPRNPDQERPRRLAR